MMYEAQADTINVDDISRNSNNRIVLRRLQRDYPDDLIPTLRIDDEPHDDEHNYDDEEDCIYYFPEGVYDMGWLGYFVGKSDYLQMLMIEPFTPPSGSSVRDVMEPFFRGVSNNKSIHCIKFDSMDMLGGETFKMLGPFFKNNHNLTNITIDDCDFGDEGARLFALALGSCKKSLQRLDLQNNNIADEGMVDIITALSMHPHLEYLDLDGNGLRKDGCVALGTLLRCSATKLRKLFISHNEINDEGIEALVLALRSCSCLQSLNICASPSITTRGWQRFATILESPNSNNLESISIASNNVDDEAAATFANALMNNRKLEELILNYNPITNIGWLAFSKVLCNTSSVNATFLSNHTLCFLGDEVNDHAIIGPLLDLNERDDEEEVVMIKILQKHIDFDMLPFFEWEFKVLPLALSWLERASEYEMPEDFEPNIEERKLSIIYQFVRGMPVLYVETRLRKELEDIKTEESQMEEEQLKLHQELQLLQERKELLEQRKKSIMRKIGQPNNFTEQRVLSSGVSGSTLHQREGSRERLENS